MHDVLVNRLGGLSLPRGVVRTTVRPDMTFDVYRGRKTTHQQHKKQQHDAVMTSHRRHYAVMCLFDRMVDIQHSLLTAKTKENLAKQSFCFSKCNTVDHLYLHNFKK